MPKYPAILRNKALMLVLCLGSFSLPAALSSQALAQQKEGVLIRDIRIEGFVLGDKERFIKLFRRYRNKYLTPSDMDDILQKIAVIYEREGYKPLVSISYKVIKRRLVYTVLMTS